MRRLHWMGGILIAATMLCLPRPSEAFDWSRIFGGSKKPEVKPAMEKKGEPQLAMPGELEMHIKRIDLDFVDPTHVRIDGKVVPIAEPVMSSAPAEQEPEERTDLVMQSGKLEDRVRRRPSLQLGTIEYLDKDRIRVACYDGRWNEEEGKCDCYTGARSPNGLSCQCPAGSTVFRLNPLIRLLLGYTEANEPRWCGCYNVIRKDGETHFVWDALTDIEDCPACLGDDLRPSVSPGDPVESGLYEGGTYASRGQCACPGQGPELDFSQMTCTFCRSGDPHYRLVNNLDEAGNILGVAGCGCALPGDEPADPNPAAVYRGGECRCIEGAERGENGYCRCKGEIEGERCVRCEEMGQVWNGRRCIGCQNKWMVPNADGTVCRYESATSGSDLGCPLYPAIDDFGNCPDVSQAFRNRCGPMVQRRASFGAGDLGNGVCLYQYLTKAAQLQAGNYGTSVSLSNNADFPMCLPVLPFSEGDETSPVSVQWVQELREVIEEACNTWARGTSRDQQACRERFDMFYENDPDTPPIEPGPENYTTGFFAIERDGSRELFYTLGELNLDAGTDMLSCDEARDIQPPNRCYCQSGARIEYSQYPRYLMEQNHIKYDHKNVWRYRICTQYKDEEECRQELQFGPE